MKNKNIMFCRSCYSDTELVSSSSKGSTYRCLSCGKLLIVERFDFEDSSGHKISECRAAKPEPSPSPGILNVAEYVLKDISFRVEFGRKKYGTVLQTSNGRDALNDAYQEALDLVMYLKQAILERDYEKNKKS